ncbi:anti-sigma factor domain-containing protein [Streptomyces sp. enrichment culture]|uniref:anti-sigma factor domain-containing protein n=1 Tax=Streptomyces sp. enrichment culture TaxID=1795815 RepID=UPI003F5615AA
MVRPGRQDASSTGLMGSDRTCQTVPLSGSARSASATGITVEPTGGSPRPRPQRPWP